MLKINEEENFVSSYELKGAARRQYYFGESVGLLIFQPWYYCIVNKGHLSYAPTFDFPVRIKFVPEPFDSAGFTGGNPEWGGWTLPNWIHAAKELEEEGVKAIVGGCGLSGTIQGALAAAVDIPVYTSSMLFLPMLANTMAAGKRVGVLTHSEEMLNTHDRRLFKECHIDDSIPIAVAGMVESENSADWLQLGTENFDNATAEKMLVEEALGLRRRYPDINALLLECTEMPPYADAIRKATGLPVFDSVDMVKLVHNMVRPGA